MSGFLPFVDLIPEKLGNDRMLFRYTRDDFLGDPQKGTFHKSPYRGGTDGILQQCCFSEKISSSQYADLLFFTIVVPVVYPNLTPCNYLEGIAVISLHENGVINEKVHNMSLAGYFIQHLRWHSLLQGNHADQLTVFQFRNRVGDWLDMVKFRFYGLLYT